MPSNALKQVFSLAKAKTVAAWKTKTVFCSGSGEAEFPLEQQITKRGGCLLFPLNWAQPPPSPRCWHKTKLLLLGGYTPVHCRKEAGHCFLAVFPPPRQICRFSRLPSLPMLLSVLGTARCHTGEAAHGHTGGPEGFYLFSPCG